MADMFADLVPAKGGGLGFDDLIPKSKPKRTAGQDFRGATAQFNSVIPLGDELVAAGNTAFNTLTGKTKWEKGSGRSALSAIGGDFKSELGRQRGYEADFQEARPKFAALSRGGGMAAQAVIPAGKTLSALTTGGTRAANMVGGALAASGSGALYAAADRGTPQERLKAAVDTATSPVTMGLGALAGALAPAARKAKPAKAERATDAQILADIGVSTSVPQKMGGMAKQTEDLAMRAPILGPTISGARSREVEQLNRGIALKALEPIGAKLPKEIKPGFDMVEYVDDSLGKVYDDAAKMVPVVQVDQPFGDEMAQVIRRQVDLPEGEAAQFTRIIDDRLTRLQSGEASGEMVKQIHSELGGLQAEAARKGNTTLAGMLGDTRRSLMGLIERANPAAGELIRKADKGWSIYSIMNDAAAQATNRGGVFLPGQLNQQVRGAGKRMGSNMAGKGRAPLQDIATAATRMIPDQFGNPGTANALGLGGMGVGLMTEPVTTVATAGALSAASTPYLMMGRKVLEELPANASRQQLMAVDARLAELAAKDPSVAALRREVAARLARAAGASGPALQSRAAPSALSEANR